MTEGETPLDRSTSLRPPRLPGTYAGNYERAADPKKGRLRLLVFALASVLLDCGYLLLLLALGSPWPALFVAGARLLITGALLVALWSGAGWTRWALALVYFCIGGWLLVHAIGSGLFIHFPGLTTRWFWLARQAPLALGTFYLLATGWFAFSADLSAFVESQRARMTRGDRLAIATLLVLCTALPVAGWAFLAFRAWDGAEQERELRGETEQGTEFAIALVRHAIERHDFAVFENWLEPAAQGSLRQSLAPDWLGRQAIERVRQDALKSLSAASVHSEVSPDGSRKLTCNVIATFSQGTAVFHLVLARAQGRGEWRIEWLVID